MNLLAACVITKKTKQIHISLIVFILISFWTFEISAQSRNYKPAASKPNIVFFFVDDYGWSDIGFRNPVFETPNIDQLAEDGLSFEQAYIASPTCSPSRATLLTGKHPARLKLVRHITGGPDEEFNYWKTDPARFPSRNWLPLEHTTYAEAINELGYYNLFVGKWHLGHEQYHPIHQGYDQQIGTSNAGNPRSYYPPYFNNSKVLAEEKQRYLTDKLTDEAVGFIKTYDRNQPFMLSFWYYSVHSPHEGRRELVEYFKAKGLEGKFAHYAAMVKSVDESVGRVRDALKKKNIDDNTIIILLSDQGGYFENRPFRGGKMHDTLYEGGARVPFLLYWPGVTRKGAKNNSIVQSTDLFPTLVEIAGGDPANYKNLDGISLLPAIRSNNTLKRDEPIYGYRAYEDLYASVRQDDWKLLAYRSGMLKLYNIKKDMQEEHDLAAAHPAKVQQLKQELVEWEKEMGVEEYSGVKAVGPLTTGINVADFGALPDGKDNTQDVKNCTKNGGS